MRFLMLLLVILSVSANSYATLACKPRESSSDFAYASIMTVSGKLRKNKNLEGTGTHLPPEVRSLKFVLVSDQEDMWVDVGSEGALSCKATDFTLTLNDTELAKAEACFKRDETAVAQGIVTRAEVTLEEIDNFVLMAAIIYCRDSSPTGN